MSGPNAIEEKAAVFLLRREEPDWTSADEIELEAWLAESYAHKAAFWRLEHGWQRSDRLAALRSPAAPSQEGDRRNTPRRSSASGLRGKRWLPAAVAASLVAAIGLTFALNRAPEIPARSYATDIGAHSTVPLEDGSRVEMNTATAMRTRIGGRQRQVWLDRGEAYFEVAHDTARAFTVMAGARKIVVVGTKFSVRRDGERIVVAVVEGKVRVEPGEGAEAAVHVLGRGDIVQAEGDSTVLKHVSAENVAEQLSWRDGMLTFDHSTLRDAAGEFNRYNRKKLVVSGRAADLQIGGAFQAANVDAFGRLLRSAYGLKVRDDGQQMVVTE